jgi:hypothetical protein
MAPCACGWNGPDSKLIAPGDALAGERGKAGLSGMVKRNIINFIAGQAALVFILVCGMSAALFAQAPSSAAAADTGQISGMISFEGQKPELKPIGMTNYPVCVSLHPGPVLPQDGQVNPDGSLPNAFVYIESADVNLPSTPPRNPVVLTQKGCEYVPHVLGVMVGQPFEVVNLDPATHNIHVMAKINPQWNVSQLPGSRSVVRKFQHPEIMIPVHCNVHSWMLAYVGVVDNPFYAVTGTDGVYTLGVWTATFGTEKRQVTVHAGETTSADFTLGNH